MTITGYPTPAVIPASEPESYNGSSFQDSCYVGGIPPRMIRLENSSLYFDKVFGSWHDGTTESLQVQKTRIRNRQLDSA